MFRHLLFFEWIMFRQSYLKYISPFLTALLLQSTNVPLIFKSFFKTTFIAFKSKSVVRALILCEKMLLPQLSMIFNFNASSAGTKPSK